MSRPSREERWAQATPEERERLIACGFEPPVPLPEVPNTHDTPDWLQDASRSYEAIWVGCRTRRLG